jgi:hypothetical protein
MTIRVDAWYRVKTTRQFCVIQKIPSTTDPRVSIREATETTRGFELAVTWYAPADESLQKWTKRVMILEIRKAAGLFREPNEEDLPIIDRIKSIAHTIPIFAASRDGEFTLPI